jgi:hypothetical protein
VISSTRQIEFVFMAVVAPAILCPVVGKHALQENAVLLVRDHPVVEEIGGGERLLAVVAGIGSEVSTQRCGNSD